MGIFSGGPREHLSFCSAGWQLKGRWIVPSFPLAFKKPCGDGPSRTPFLRWPLSERCRQSLDVGSHGFRRTELSSAHASLHTEAPSRTDCRRTPAKSELACIPIEPRRIVEFISTLRNRGDPNGAVGLYVDAAGYSRGSQSARRAVSLP